MQGEKVLGLLFCQKNYSKQRVTQDFNQLNLCSLRALCGFLTEVFFQNKYLIYPEVNFVYDMLQRSNSFFSDMDY